MKNGSYFPNHETLIRTLWQMNQQKTLKTLANEKKIIRLIQFENAVQSLCVFKHRNTVRIAPKIKLFFQNFPHISIYNDLAATNHNSFFPPFQENTRNKIAENVIYFQNFKTKLNTKWMHLSTTTASNETVLISFEHYSKASKLFFCSAS